MNRNYEDMAYHLRGSASLINHRHQNPDSYEIIQIVSGEGTAFLLDHTYPLKEGMLLLIDAAYLHCISPLDVSHYCRSKLIVDKQYLQGILSAIQAEAVLEHLFRSHAGACFYLSQPQAQNADELFRDMQEASVYEEGKSNLVIASSLIRLLMMCASTAGQSIPSRDDKLSPVLKYLCTHFSEPLTVDQIAQQTHLSKYHLCRLFHRQTGLTLMQYLYEYRLSVARQELTSTNRPISAIAQDCGFSNSSHFCALFRRREGMPPKEYRKKWHAVL